MTSLQIVSTGVLGLIGLGVWQRRNPPVHRALMLLAFAVDLGMVLFIELSRHAVDQAVSTHRPLLRFHVAVSTLALAAYLVQLALGWRLVRHSTASRVWHFRVGITFVVLRLTNYVTSFLIN